jgi:AraC-like DNA-binding protein
MPAGSLSLVVCLGAPIVVRCAGRAEVVAVATVGGLRTEPLDIVHDGTQRGVQLALTPRGARALLGAPAGALAHGVFPLEDVVGRRCLELTDRLTGAADRTERAEVLDSVLTSWLAEHSYCEPVEAMWHRLVLSAGAAPVAIIAADVGYGRRHLAELARAELGLTPKQAARVLRFAHARSRIASAVTTNLAEVAVACGYFDQAHLTNDWKRLAGCTPGEWISQELPFLQDMGGAPGRH